MVLPKREDYKEKLLKYEEKDMGSLTILNQGINKTIHLCEYDINNDSLIESHPPTLYQGEYTREYKKVVDPKLRKEDSQQ
jgi:hypothetical protein